MKMFIKKGSSKFKLSPLTGVVGVLVIVVLLLLFNNVISSKPKVNTQVVKASTTTGLVGATSLAQKIYNIRLQTWSESEFAFINNNRTWFTKNFLNHSIDYHTPKTQLNLPSYAGPFLFCSNPSNKPNGIKVTAGKLSNNAQTALVYVNASYGGKSEIANLPVQLQSEKGYWAIDLVSCSSI